MASASPGARRRRVVAFAVGGVFLLVFLAYLGWRSRLYLTPRQTYQQTVSAFTSGVLAMNVSDDEHALRYLLEATRLHPDEPAAQADLGLFYLRHSSGGDYKPAQEALAKAHALDPNNEQIEIFQGLLAQKQGAAADAVAHFQRAVTLAPSDVKARYALIQALGQSGTGGDAEVRRQWEAMAAAQPDNLYVTLQLATVAAKAGDLPRLRAVVQQVAPLTAAWPADITQTFHGLQTAAGGTNARDAAPQAQFLNNVLGDTVRQPVPAYQRGRSAVGADVSATSDQIGAPLERFLHLTNPPATPAAPDFALTFTAEPLAASGTGTSDQTVQSAWLTPQGPSVLVAQTAGLQVSPPASPPATIRFPGDGAAHLTGGVLAADWSNDFNVDLVLAQAGLIFYQQQPNGGFLDVTAHTKLPPSILTAAYTGAWAADIDTDGDLDVIVGTRTGPPTVLRNNADGTWTPLRPFPGLATGLRGWGWADLDDDGLPDAIVLDARGRLSVFENKRSGVFAPWPLPASLGAVAAVAVADADRDGVPDITALGTDGVVRRVTRMDEGTGDGWTVSEIARWAKAPKDGSARLLWEDLDNNGGLDLIATGGTGTQIWLSGVGGALKPLAPLDARSVSVENPAKGGRLNLVGVSAAGLPVRLVNKGAKSYGWQDVRLRSQLTHDRRNNAYGIGGQIQLRAGLLYEKQIVSSPVTHFGLGDYARADYVRIVWPNGSPQGEFEFKPNAVFSPLERLKGSCPWLFADDGHGMKFVTDLIWRSPLGLRINAQNTAGVAMTRDRVRIAGSQLAPVNGSLNLSVTAELWETHFFDFLSLLAVDHPAGTDVYTDERFAIPPPPLDLRALTPPTAARRAVDDRGQDVTDTVKVRDGRYLDTFGRGDYQGITRDHSVEVDLGKTPVTDKHPWLVAEGWIHPTDSSLNLALSQGKHAAPRDLSLEVPDARGGWRTARPHLGFPAGKNKTVLIDLNGLFRPGQERHLRLRTNLEIYWDFIGSASERPASTLRIRRLSPTVADLRDRGYSVTHQADASSPELPDYNAISGTAPRWVDLVGYCTRFGDVRPLVQRVDDRYVIMNAGDELKLRFASPPPPPPGWVRDYVLEADGWEKDGDWNTGFSKTVLPLPSHDRPSYDAPLRRLQDDPVYKRHPRDWQTYHTRYITPERFQNAVRPHL